MQAAYWIIQQYNPGTIHPPIIHVGIWTLSGIDSGTKSTTSTTTRVPVPSGTPAVGLTPPHSGLRTPFRIAPPALIFSKVPPPPFSQNRHPPSPSYPFRIAYPVPDRAPPLTFSKILTKSTATPLPPPRIAYPAPPPSPPPLHFQKFSRKAPPPPYPLEPVPDCVLRSGLRPPPPPPP